MNIYLLLSSIICSLLIFLIITYRYKHRYDKIYLCFILGAITSILNHSTSNIYLKYLDRIIITIIVIYLYLLFSNFLIRGLLLTAVFYYLISKLNYLKSIQKY